MVSIADLIPVQAAYTTLSTMEELTNRDTTAFHIVVTPFVSKRELETGFQAYEQFLIRVVGDCLISGTDKFPEEVRETVRELLRKDHHIFKRIADGFCYLTKRT